MCLASVGRCSVFSQIFIAEYEYPYSEDHLLQQEILEADSWAFDTLLERAVVR